MFMGNRNNPPHSRRTPKHQAPFRSGPFRSGTHLTAGVAGAASAAAAAAAAAAALVAAAAPASAVVPAAPGASLRLTVAQDDQQGQPGRDPGPANPGGPMRPGGGGNGGGRADGGDAPNGGAPNGGGLLGHQDSALLDCYPPGGTHPHAAEACSELAAAGGRFDRLHPAANEHRMCPMLYSPVTVSASGEWRGAPVSYQHTFGNLCEAERATGDVFALNGDRHPDLTA
jgi:hypothetical protein